MKYDILSLELADNQTLYFFKENNNDTFGDEVGEKRYLYEEHQCATNLLGDFEEIIPLEKGIYDGGPHGIFTYETTIETEVTEPNELSKIFKEHLNKLNETV